MTEPQDDQDLEPLPEPEQAGEPDDDADAPDFSDLLEPFDDDQSLDDAQSPEVDDGIELDDYADATLEGEERLLDIGEISEPVQFAEALEGDDAAVSDDESAGIVELEPAGLDGGEEGSEEPEDLIDGELPSLDADDDEWDEPPADSTAMETTDDEPAAPRADPPWTEVTLSPSPSRSLVLHAGSRRIACGADIVLVDDTGREKALVKNASGTVTSLVPDFEHGFVIYSTRAGELLRSTKGGNPSRLTGWLEAGGFDRQRIFGVHLGGLTPSSRPAVLLHVADGHGSLLESTDHGNTWRRVDLGGAVLCLASGTPPMVLVQVAREVRLFRSEPTGGFTFVGSLSPEDPDATRIAVHGAVVTVLEPDRGVRVSADSGALFRRAAGCLRATAVASGFVGGRPSGFASLYDVGSARASIAWIDAVTGETAIVGQVSPDDDDDGDSARVLSLSWDPLTETLWTAGAFGLRCFRRPLSA